jgi:hypothetical protein
MVCAIFILLVPVLHGIPSIPVNCKKSAGAAGPHYCSQRSLLFFDRKSQIAKAPDQSMGLVRTLQKLGSTGFI